MKTPLVEGRTFLPPTPRLAAGRRRQPDARAPLLSRTATPIGHRIMFEFFDGRPEWTIVGVVGDEQFDDLDHPMVPVVYFPFAQDPEGPSA